MATLTVQTIDNDGLTPSYAAATAGGDDFVCQDDQRTYLEIINSGGSAITVTIPAQQSTALQSGVGQVTVAALTASVAATTGRAKIGPIGSAHIRANDGKVQVTYSAVTSVTVGVFRLPRSLG